MVLWSSPLSHNDFTAPPVPDSPCDGRLVSPLPQPAASLSLFSGTVRFTTIYPGWYSGRTVHIHARVRVYDAATDTVTYNQTTQFFFNDQASNQIFTLAPYNQRSNRDTFNATDNIIDTVIGDANAA